MGIWDYIAGNNPAAGAAVNPNDPAGAYLGNLIDPQTAAQFQAARAQQGLLGLAIGMGQASGASRLPISDLTVLGSGLAGMANQQNLLPTQALQSAQTANTISEAALHKMQTLAAVQQMSVLQARIKAAQDELTKATGGGGTDLTTGPIAQPGGSGAGKAVSSTTADTTMEPVQRALLDTIAGPESAGAYNVRYTPKGGATFDSYAGHPRIYEPGPQGPSSAAGRYQIVASTFDPLAAQYGYKDFSPVTQDQAAWNLAANTYKGKTGRDLLTDLKAGRTQDVGPALAGQWATLNRAMPNFQANLAKYGNTAGGGSSTPNNLPPVPNFSGAITGNMGAPYAPGFTTGTVSTGNAPAAAGNSGVLPMTVNGGPPVSVPPGGVVGAPVGYGVPNATQIAQAKYRVELDAAMGKTPNPNDVAIAGFGVNVALKGAEAQQHFGAQAQYAGQEAYNKGQGSAPFELVPMTVGGVEIQIPKNIVLQGPAAIQRYAAALTGQPAAPTPAPAPAGLINPQGGTVNPPIAPATQPTAAPAAPPRYTLADYTPAQLAAAKARGMMMSNGLPSVPPDTRFNSMGVPYTTAPTGGVPAGSPGAGPVITPAMAAQQNAQLRASGYTGMPVMPSSFVFGAGMAPPANAGRVGTGSPPVAGNAVPAPMTAPAATPAPQAPQAAPVTQPGQAYGTGSNSGLPAIGKPYINPLYQSGIEKVVGSDNERIAKELVPQGDKANDMIQTATMIKDLMGKVSTGWGADTLQTASQILARLGAKDEDIAKLTGMQPSAGDVIRKMFLQQSAAAVRVMGAREPGSVISLFGKAYPSLESQPNAIELMENVFLMQAKRSQDLIAGAQAHQNEQLDNLRQNKGYKPLTNFETQFNSTLSGTSPANYLKAAEAMSGINAWKGMSKQTEQQVWSLIPKGASVVFPDGSTQVKQ